MSSIDLEPGQEVYIVQGIVVTGIPLVLDEFPPTLKGIYEKTLSEFKANGVDVNGSDVTVLKDAEIHSPQGIVSSPYYIVIDEIGGRSFSYDGDALTYP